MSCSATFCVEFHLAEDPSLKAPYEYYHLQLRRSAKIPVPSSSCGSSCLDAQNASVRPSRVRSEEGDGGWLPGRNSSSLEVSAGFRSWACCCLRREIEEILPFTAAYFGCPARHRPCCDLLWKRAQPTSLVSAARRSKESSIIGAGQLRRRLEPPEASDKFRMCSGWS